MIEKKIDNMDNGKNIDNENNAEDGNQVNAGSTSSGFVAIIGRPNVGKSTLLNYILGEKVSITTAKPQTTRHKIIGVKTIEEAQVIYVDTPGIHQGETRAINKYMNKTARSALRDVDIILFVIEAVKWTDEDELVLDLISKQKCPVLLLVNKVDAVKDKTKLLPYLTDLSHKFAFTDIIPLSATKGDNVPQLEQKIASLLPKGPHYYPSDQVTDRSMKFRVAEIIREKLMLNLEEELPYGITVEIEMFVQEERRIFISAIIWVERESQKPIVIGKQGSVLKRVGISSRKDIGELLDQPAHIKLWVKVKDGWSDNSKELTHLGYD
jgi:GTPase